MAWQNPITTWGQSGQTVPGAADFNRIEENIRILGQYDRAPAYAVASGSANAYTVTLNPAPASYYDGMCIAVKINVNNTGASTINVNGLGAKPIKKSNGNDVAAGNLRANSIYTLRYNGTTGNFILQGSDSTGNATAADVLAGKTFSNDSNIDLIGTMPNNGAWNGTITLSNSTSGSVTIPTGYHSGGGKVTAIVSAADLIASNIREGKSILGVTGTLKEIKVAYGDVDAEIYWDQYAESNRVSYTVRGLGFKPNRLLFYGYSKYPGWPQDRIACAYWDGAIQIPLSEGPFDDSEPALTLYNDGFRLINYEVDYESEGAWDGGHGWYLATT